MSTTEIIFVSVLAAAYLITQAGMVWQDKIIKIYKKHYELTNELTDTMVEYCFKDIIQRAIDREDYITAKKCTDLQNQLLERKKK